EVLARMAKKVGEPFLLWGPRDESPLPDGKHLHDTQYGLFATSNVLKKYGVPFMYIVNSRVDSIEFERGFKTFLGAARAARNFCWCTNRSGKHTPLEFLYGDYQ
ncbi:hypothetical protein KA005_80860, partial [bacterium]|nr:hypothetical protein [bacterium]